MKIKLDIKEIKSYKEEAMANFLEIVIDDFMYLMKTLDELEEIDEEDKE